MRFWCFLRDIAILVRMCWHFPPLYLLRQDDILYYIYNLLINYVYTTICNFCFWLWVQFQPIWWLGGSGSVLCISTFPIEWEAKELQIELPIHDSLSDIASTNWQWAMLGGKERKPLLDWDDTFGIFWSRKSEGKGHVHVFFTVYSKLIPNCFFPGFIITIDSIDLR
jgi:hypothetical protein